MKVDLTLTPGPNETPPYISGEMIHGYTHPDLDPEFKEYYFRLTDMVRSMVNTHDGRAFVFLGSGTLSLETAIVNLTGKSDKILVLSNGFFGKHMKRIVENTGRTVLLWESGFGEKIKTPPRDLQRDVKAVVLVHCETSNGVLNDIREIRDELGDEKLLIVDGISSIGATDIKMDFWGIDALVGVGHKALNTPPGNSLLVLSRRALDEAKKNHAESYYLNVGLWEEYYKGRFYLPYTLSPYMLKALEASLALIKKEGLPNVYQRHMRIMGLSYKIAEALGFRPVQAPGTNKCPSITVVQPPVGMSAKDIHRRLLEEHSILVAYGIGRESEKIIRIGHMGYYAKEKYLKRLYYALADILGTGETSKNEYIGIVDSFLQSQL